MQRIILYLFLMSCFSIVSAQKNKIVKGPVIKDYGQIFKIENPDLLLQTHKEYRVIFDIYTDEKNNNKLNANINTVARFINMHAQQGVPLKNLNIVVVLHGAATKNALTNKAYKNHYKNNNPNSKLLEELTSAQVELYVCGQSFASKQFKRKELSDNVKLSLSALTALIEYQSKDYQLITFN